MQRKTLARAVWLRGEGIWGPYSLELHPSHLGKGMLFNGEIPVSFDAVTKTKNLIRLTQNGKSVSVVEHILAVLLVFGITDVFINIDRFALPTFEEGIQPMIDAIQAVGIVPVRGRRVSPFIVVEKDKVTDGAGRSLYVEPSDDLRISYSIDFPSYPIGFQSIEHLPITLESVENELSYARAFTPVPSWFIFPDRVFSPFIKKWLIARNSRYLNDVRYDGTEPVRHKIVDFLGALGLLGVPVFGHFSLEKSGHTFDVFALKELLGRGSLAEKK